MYWCAKFRSALLSIVIMRLAIADITNIRPVDEDSQNESSVDADKPIGFIYFQFKFLRVKFISQKYNNKVLK